MAIIYSNTNSSGRRNASFVNYTITREVILNTINTMQRREILLLEVEFRDTARL